MNKTIYLLILILYLYSLNNQTWQPLGRATLVDTDSSGPHPDDSTSHSPNPSLSGSNIRRKSSNLRPDDTTSHSPNPSLSGSNIRRKSSSATIQSNSAASVTAPTGPMGCPIKVQTAPGIKMLTQVCTVLWIDLDY